MLHKIRANGFRSLIDFELDLRPGLNVLVGPNGAGKTNILKYIEFLSNLSTGTVSEAISRSGGAAEVFNRLSIRSGAATIQFGFEGSRFAQTLFRNNKKIKHKELFFKFYAEISLAQNSVFFTEQQLTVWSKHGKSRTHEPKPDLDVRVSFSEKININISIAREGIENSLEPHLMSKTEPSNMEAEIKGILSKEKSLVEQPLFRVLSHFFWSLNVIRRDILPGKVYNIIPNKVREPEDIARKPGISADGSGLASTLLALERTSIDNDETAYFFDSAVSFPVNSRTRIQEFSQLVSEEICELSASNDYIENKIRVSVLTKSHNGADSIPISYLSDGTVKWFSIVSALVINKDLFCVEEPENFLHPKLQQEIVDITRSLCSDSIDRTIIMTTHSETLLDRLKAEEVIVTRKSGNTTICSRPKNAVMLNELIMESGFGLGYFYKTGAIE